MTKEEGIVEIDSAQWEQDAYGCLNLYVHKEDGDIVHCWLSLRPTYCDRGHMQLNIEGALDIDMADSFPRFFFHFREADEHTRTFLKWRIWRHRIYPHTLTSADVAESEDALASNTSATA